MECVWIVFSIIGFGIWILVTLFRKAEEERQRNLQRPPGGGVRRPVTDLDRFLEEARRRKEGQGRPPADAPWAQPVGRAPRPVGEARPAAPRPPERPREFVPSVRRSASEQRPQVPMARPTVTQPGRRSAEAPPSSAPVILELVEEVVTPAIGLPADRQAPPPPAAPLGGVLARPANNLSPVLANLPILLKQPQTIAAVFALREIFGPPLCRHYMLPTNAITPRS